MKLQTLIACDNCKCGYPVKDLILVLRINKIEIYVCQKCFFQNMKKYIFSKMT
jgi:hypothetical protein